MSSILGNSHVTPSEVVLLCGERFAPRGGILDKYKLLHADLEVSRKQLAVQAFAAAFLAVHHNGEIRLQMRERKKLLGLRTVRLPYADPGQASIHWPVGTLEFKVRAAAAELCTRGGLHEVKWVVSASIAQDAADPYGRSLDLVKEGLAQRGLLTAIDQKRMKIFTVRTYALTPSALPLASAEVDVVLWLLSEFHRIQPVMWNLITGEIRAGIDCRKEQSDDSSTSDG